MSIFDCVDTSCLPGKPDREIIDLGVRCDAILKEIQLFTQETLTKIVSMFEQSIAYQENTLNNSLQYIRSIVDTQTQNISNVLTVNRESISNLVNQILTELIIQLNVNGLPIGTEIELSRPIVIENQVNNYDASQTTNYNIVENSGGYTFPTITPIGANDNDGNQIRPAGGPITIAPARPVEGPSQDNGGSIETIRPMSPGCNKGDVAIVVYPDGSQFYGLTVGNLENNNQLAIVVIGPVGSIVAEQNFTLVNTLLGQSANLPPSSLSEYINTQILPQLAPVVPPLVQSPGGSLLPSGVSNPVNIEQPEAFRFQQRGQPWFRQAIDWAGKDFTDYQNSSTFKEYFDGVFSNMQKEWIPDEK